MSIVTHETDGHVTTITIDDGKVNALSPDMFNEIALALDTAESHGTVVVLRGREGVFSAGFDLTVLQAGGPDAADMLAAGFDLAQRLLSFPAPVVIACTGHAIAMASFLLLTGDYRVAVQGPFKITANEVAIGMTMPHAAVEICRHRLAPTHFHRAVALAEVFTPDDAVAAGFVDRVVDAGDLDETIATAAQTFGALHRPAHAETKLRERAKVLQAIQEGAELDGLSLAL
jgi:enoyl-CoA hydratase